MKQNGYEPDGPMTTSRTSVSPPARPPGKMFKMGLMLKRLNGILKAAGILLDGILEAAGGILLLFL